MQRWLVLGATLGLLAALALSPVGAAAPQLWHPCNLASSKCRDLPWNGLTSQGGMNNTETGGAITFVTDRTKSWVGDFQWAVGNEHCTVTGTTSVPINMGLGDPPEVGRHVRAVGGTASVPINMGYGVQTKAGWQAPVVAGHFSKTWTLTRPDFATRHLPTTVVWHLTGTLSGIRASGTMQW